MAVTSGPLAEALSRCNKCGFCLARCPIYKATGIEWAGARGRIAMIRGALLENKLDINEMDDPVFNCLTCNACSDDCPAGVKVADIIFEAREELSRQRGSSWKTQLMFNKLLSNPSLMHKASGILRLADMTGLRQAARKTGLTKIMGDAGKAEAMVPPVPSKTGLAEIRRAVSVVEHPAYRVAYFVGCHAANLAPAEAKAAIRILNRHQVDVIVPDFVCCGIPAPAYGDKSSARRLARRNIEIAGKFNVDAIVTSCASCGSFLKEYARLLSGDKDWAERARGFSAKVRDITEFLDNIKLITPTGAIKKKVTFHDPCHLVRYQKISRQPRTLLKSIPGVELIELKEADICCGAAGTYGFKNYDLSMKVLDRKMGHIASTNAEIVVSSCPSCIMQLAQGARTRKMPIETISLMQLLDRAYRHPESK